MNLRRFVFMIGLLATSAPPAQAECVACTMSHGIRIKTKSGAMAEGYMPWNKFGLEELVMAYGLKNHPAGRNLSEGWEALTDPELFARWIEAINLIIQENLSPQPKYSPPRLTVIPNLVQIKYPIERYVAIQGEVREFPLVNIAQVSMSPKHSLSVDTTGIDTLPKADALLLRMKKPRFTVEEEHSTGASVYAVYGKAVSLADVLEHIVSISGNNFGTILVNRIKITTNARGGGWPAIDLNNSPGLRPWKGDIEKFNARLGEIGGISRGKWKSLGTEEQLRTQGVVQFSYAWD